MVDVRTLQEFGRALANGVDGHQHRVAFVAAADGFETFTDGLNHGGGHGFAGFTRELLSELVSFRCFDVEAHVSTILEVVLPVYLSSGPDVISRVGGANSGIRRGYWRRFGRGSRYRRSRDR